MFKEIARTSYPLIVAQVTFALMTFIDTLLMGKLGVEVLAGGGLGSVVYQFVYMVAIGVLVASANMIAFAKGRNDSAAIKQAMLSGSVLVLLLSILSITLLCNISPFLVAMGQQPGAITHAQVYLDVVSWSLVPAFGFILLRSLVTGFGDTKIILPISIGAAVLNYPLSYVLMTGAFGLPVMGLQGVALGTCLISLAMFMGLSFLVFRQKQYKPYDYWRAWDRFSWPQFLETLRLGIPIALAHAMEVGLFSAAALLIGWLGIIELAAHQVALQGTALSFMIPLAISQAVSVKVGELYGAGQVERVKLAVKAGIQLALLGAGIAVSIFWFWPELLIDAFVDKSIVDSENYQSLFKIASQILIVAALFQLVDGWQVIFMGALRGFKLGVSPTVVAIVSYWAIGFPISYFLLDQYGAVGVWSGMGIGLAVSALALGLLLIRQLRLHS